MEVRWVGGGAGGAGGGLGGWRAASLKLVAASVKQARTSLRALWVCVQGPVCGPLPLRHRLRRPKHGPPRVPGALPPDGRGAQKSAGLLRQWLPRWAQGSAALLPSSLCRLPPLLGPLQPMHTRTAPPPAAAAAAFPVSFFERLEALEPVWVPYYVMHKLMQGRVDLPGGSLGPGPRVGVRGDGSSTSK